MGKQFISPKLRMNCVWIGGKNHRSVTSVTRCQERGWYIMTWPFLVRTKGHFHHLSLDSLKFLKTSSYLFANLMLTVVILPNSILFDDLNFAFLVWWPSDQMHMGCHTLSWDSRNPNSKDNRQHMILFQSGPSDPTLTGTYISWPTSVCSWCLIFCRLCR